MSHGTPRWCAGALLAAVLLLGGCAQLVPQTMALRTGWPAGVPQTVELTAVPFFPQDEYQCGPAALATLLAHTGLDITPESLVPQVYVPARRGSLQIEMLAAARRHGRVAYVLAPRYADLLREVAAGHPVVVLQDVGMLASEWHYAVVNGFDYPSGTVYLRSGIRARQEMSFTALERSWIQSGYWAMVAVPPARIPATADETSWLAAIVAFERAKDYARARDAYSAFLERWPDNVSAAIGLANALYAQGELPQAEKVLRGAVARSPGSAIALNNLAQTLSDQGRDAEALPIAERAVAAGGPNADAVRQTRDEILKKIEAKKN